MTFLEQCIQDSMPIWQDCLESEFVQGVAHGTLPEECFKGYIVDDSLYLREYSKVFAWGILHSHDMEEIATTTPCSPLLTRARMPPGATI